MNLYESYELTQATNEASNSNLYNGIGGCSLNCDSDGKYTRPYDDGATPSESVRGECLAECAAFATVGKG